MCSVTKEAYAIVSATDMFKKQTRHINYQEQQNMNIESMQNKHVKKMNKSKISYAEYNKIMHQSMIGYLKGMVYSACKRKCKAVFLKNLLEQFSKVLIKQKSQSLAGGVVYFVRTYLLDKNLSGDLNLVPRKSPGNEVAVIQPSTNLGVETSIVTAGPPLLHDLPFYCRLGTNHPVITRKLSSMGQSQKFEIGRQITVLQCTLFLENGLKITLLLHVR